MGVLHSPESAFAQERVKWEAQHTEMGPGQRPYLKREYPMMLHLAGRPANGLGAAEIIETVEVGSEREADLYRSRGFRPTPLEALDVWNGQQFEIAELAAERNFDERRMSARARQEAETANAHAVDHLASVPETPIRRRVPASRVPASVLAAQAPPTDNPPPPAAVE